MRVIPFDHTKGLLSMENPMVIYVFADTHIGYVGADIEKLERHIEMCREEDAYWIHLGDWCDSIGPWDKRFDITHSPDPVEYQYKQAQKLFEPIKENGIAILQGNHDDTIRRTYGDKVATLANNLNVPYLGYSGFVGVRTWHHQKYLDERRGADFPFTMYLHHGHGMGRLLGAKAINLHRLSHKFMADIYLIGHIHTFTRHIDEYLKVNRSRQRTGRLYLREEYRVFASAPGYYRGYIDELNKYDEPMTTYIERHAMYPQPTGCLRLVIYPKSRGPQTNRPEGGQDEPGRRLIIEMEPVFE